MLRVVIRGVRCYAVCSCEGRRALYISICYAWLQRHSLYAMIACAVNVWRASGGWLEVQLKLAHWDPERATKIRI